MQGVGDPVERTEVALMVDDGTLPDVNCYEAGEVVTVRVEFGPTDAAVTSGVFAFRYDPDCLAYQSIEGSEHFPMLIYADVNTLYHRVFAAVGIAPGGSGAHGPATLAIATFIKTDRCGACDLQFVPVGPQPPVVLGSADGGWIECVPIESETIRLNGDIDLKIPQSIRVVAEAGQDGATVTWPRVYASHTCDAVVPGIECTAVHDGGHPIDHLILQGGQFPLGRSLFECSTVNSCGDTATSYWRVEVIEPEGPKIGPRRDPRSSSRWRP